MPDYAKLMDRLADGEVIILDGATGTEIERLGVTLRDDVWCAMATATHPDVVRTVHENYIRAGAEIVTTNTYASCRQYLDNGGLGHKSDDLCGRSTELAIEAREAAGYADVFVAGSIAAIGAWADMDEAQMRGDFARQAEVFAKSGADLVLLEMLGADSPTTIAAIEESAKAGLPVWVAISCMDEDDSPGVFFGVRQSRAGPGNRYGAGTFGESAAEIKQAGGDVFFVFHSHTNIAREALRQLRECVEGPVGIYPHCGDWGPPDWRFVNSITPEEFLEEAQGWVSDGAQVIGGCCGIGLDHMKLLKDTLPRRPSSLQRGSL